jgi:hypothetical protein
MHDDDRIRYRIDQLTETGTNVSLAETAIFVIQPNISKQFINGTFSRRHKNKYLFFTNAYF